MRTLWIAVDVWLEASQAISCGVRLRVFRLQSRDALLSIGNCRRNLIRSFYIELATQLGKIVLRRKQQLAKLTLEASVIRSDFCRRLQDAFARLVFHFGRPKFVR